MADCSGRNDRVVIIGAGLSGLVAAHRLITAGSGPGAGRPPEICVLESRPRAGGAIWTDHQDGFTLEGGADSFITNKPWGVDLCRELGLGDRLISTDPTYRRSFVVQKGRLLPVPDGFVLMTPSRLWPLLTSPVLSLRGKARMLLERFVPRRRETSDESLASFVRRRFGREALDRLVQPLIGGIYTADPNELSLESTLPQFPALEREYGSLIRGALKQARANKALDRGASGARYGLFASLDAGMELLPQTLLQSLPRDAVRLSTPVRRVVRPDAQGPWRVELLDGSVIEAGAVIIATEAHAAARLLDGQDPELAQQLRAIPYASSVIANVAYRRDAVTHPLNGFGAVVPIVEGRQILAVSFTSVKFPCRAPEGTVLMRVFVGGATQPHLFDLEDTQIATLVRQELAALLGVRGEPLLIEIGRHTRAMPQYTLGHRERVAAIRDSLERHPGLELAGNAYDGVGVPDVVRAAREVADRLLARLREVNRTAA